MLTKNGIFRGKSFEKSLFQESDFPWKKMYEKSAPDGFWGNRQRYLL
jgi:hypothetical protein